MSKKDKRKSKTRELTPPAFQPGDRCLFLYPLFPYFGIGNQTLKPHCVDISRIRDHLEDPLDPAEVEADPLLLRGRWQVFGTEVETGGPVSFYDTHIQHVHIISHRG